MCVDTYILEKGEILYESAVRFNKRFEEKGYMWTNYSLRVTVKLLDLGKASNPHIDIIINILIAHLMVD